MFHDVQGFLKWKKKINCLWFLTSWKPLLRRLPLVALLLYEQRTHRYKFKSFPFPEILNNKIQYLFSNSYLWSGTEQLISAGVSVWTRIKAAACKFVIRPQELRQKDLVVMVGVEQSADITGKLVKSCQPDPLLNINAGTVGRVGVWNTFLKV